jgi:hypothetical protein
MSNVVTSITRKLRSAKDGAVVQARHRRDGFFDDNDVWHDADAPSSLVDGAVAR